MSFELPFSISVVLDDEIDSWRSNLGFSLFEIVIPHLLI